MTDTILTVQVVSVIRNSMKSEREKDMQGAVQCPMTLQNTCYLNCKIFSAATFTFLCQCLHCLGKPTRKVKCTLSCPGNDSGSHLEEKCIEASWSQKTQNTFYFGTAPGQRSGRIYAASRLEGALQLFLGFFFSFQSLLPTKAKRFTLKNVLSGEDWAASLLLLKSFLPNHMDYALAYTCVLHIIEWYKIGSIF